MSFKHDNATQKPGPGVPFWPANEAEWARWHDRNAAAVRKVRQMALSDADEHTMLDMLGLLPDQLAAAENKMRSAAASTVRATPHARRHMSTGPSNKD